jgi:hypothetical protein
MCDNTNTNLSEIKRTYDLININFDAAYQKCDTDAQRKQLVALRDSARDAFWKSIAANLSDNHVLIEKSLNDLKTTNDKIQDAVKSLKDISAFLNMVTQGVTLAAAVVTLAAA